MDSNFAGREIGMEVDLPGTAELTTRVDLSGQVAIVTGAGQGIGFGIARGLAQAGATVVIADVNPDSGPQAAESLTAAGLAAVAVQTDVSDETSVNELVKTVLADHGRIDILINNAGISTNEIAEQMPVEAWRRVIDVDLTGPFICAKAVLPHMTAAGHGRIVSLGSIDGHRMSNVHGISYTVAKAGLEAFTRHLAYEVAGRGVTVNLVCPGATLTPRVAANMKNSEAVIARGKPIPRGRVTLPDDVMRTVLFLVSDLSGMVCGQAIYVDGGVLLGWTDTETYFKRRGLTLT